MIILGLHFGHDASVAVIRDGEVLCCIERERHVRIKHAMGLTRADIDLALAGCKLGVKDVDFCTVTSTQRVEYLFSNPQELSFDFHLEPSCATSAPLAAQVDREVLRHRERACVLDHVRRGTSHPYVSRLTPEITALAHSSLPGTSIGSIEDFSLRPEWTEPRGLRSLRDIPLDGILSDENALGMQLPILATLAGRQIPGLMFSHHFAHAAYAYYLSPFDQAAICSNDGSLPGTGYHNGMFYYGEDNRLYPLAPHFISVGHLYERVAMLLGLGMEAGPGKMMGLAPYGKPVFFDRRFVGNAFDGSVLEEIDSTGPLPAGFAEDPRHPLLNKWLRHCATTMTQLGYDTTPLGDTRRILEPAAVDLAASTQKLIEEILLEACHLQKHLLKRLDRHPDAICLTGGVALNCPSNSRIHAEGPFPQVFVPPAVHDAGLSIGSALAYWYNTLGHPRIRKIGNSLELAYLGTPLSAEIPPGLLESLAERIVVSTPEDLATHAANSIAENKIVGWFQGRSEIGPRALGHRSILAHPGYHANWATTNRIKHREHWRPFAPVVLEEHADECFSGIPFPSPFMLFTAATTTKALPAVTHVDGSSRIQTVNESAGLYYQVLTAFHQRTGIPAVLNTSFNGPGEPIVETAQEAIAFFLSSELDRLYLGPYLIEKRIGADHD